MDEVAQVRNCWTSLTFTSCSRCRRGLPAIAYQNKAVVYNLLFKASSQTMRTIADDPKHLGAKIGFHLGAPHLGLRDDPSSTHVRLT